MTRQPNLFVTLFQDSGGYYQCVSYGTRDVCELDLRACLCRPCFLVFGDAMPCQGAPPVRRLHNNYLRAPQQFVQLSCPLFLIIIFNPFIRVNRRSYGFPMIWKDYGHQYQPPLPFLSALESQDCKAPHGVLYRDSM